MRYSLTTQADAEYAAIYVTGVELFGVAQAEAYAKGLENAFDFIADFPLAARLRNEFDKPVRVHRFKAHLIVYLIREERVLIARIRHGREDWTTDPVNG